MWEPEGDPNPAWGVRGLPKEEEEEEENEEEGEEEHVQVEGQAVQRPQSPGLSTCCHLCPSLSPRSKVQPKQELLPSLPCTPEPKKQGQAVSHSRRGLTGIYLSVPAPPDFAPPLPPCLVCLPASVL